MRLTFLMNILMSKRVEAFPVTVAVRLERTCTFVLKICVVRGGPACGLDEQK